MGTLCTTQTCSGACSSHVSNRENEWKGCRGRQGRGSTRRQSEVRTLFSKRMVGVDTGAEATATTGVTRMADRKAVARRGGWHYPGKLRLGR